MKELLLITAPTCGPCKTMKPVMQRIAEERQLPLRIVEATPDPANVQTIQKYGVRQVPTLLHLEEGEEAHRHLGAMTEAQINETLAAWGFA